MAIKTAVAVFDFDGTLTYRDTLWDFICFSQGKNRALLALIMAIPLACLYLIGCVERQKVKEALLTTCFKGFLLSDLERQGAAFARGPLIKLINPLALERLRWHQRQGHVCLLVSANLACFLKFWGEDAGFDAVLSTELAVDAKRRLTGKIKGKNCRGHEKLCRLESVLQGIPRSTLELYVYGDSSGDNELLQAADYPYYRTFISPSYD